LLSVLAWIAAIIKLRQTADVSDRQVERDSTRGDGLDDHRNPNKLPQSLIIC
jgi:hypothetical protein